MKKKFLALLTVFTLLGTFALSNMPTEAASTDDIVILYTNDVHTYIANEDSEEKQALSYDNVAALKKELLSVTDNVLLVDAGDHIQGTAYGAMDQGQTIIQLMNQTGYDLATLGNHEFDFEMKGALAAIDTAKYPYVSCNFFDLRTNENLLDSYKIFDFGDTQVAIIGITTPDTITSSAPTYFQDENGNYIYDIIGGKDGEALYNVVQDTIDEVTELGADYVIGLGHLGVDMSSSPWTSKEVIANTSGFDAFIDGHSHTTIESELITDESGETVILTQTGSYFANVGQLTIDENGTISTELISEYKESDAEVKSSVDAWIQEVDKQLGEKIADSDVDFAVANEEGERIVRVRESNMGDFNADAYYYLLNELNGLDCDAAFINGGGVRAGASSGEWSYMTMKTINPFGNVICLMEITGQQLLDALEWGARFTTGETSEDGGIESGAFLHMAGVSYEINSDIASTVQENDGLWSGSPTGEYRVNNVRIYNKESCKYEPLILDQKYTIAGANYTLRNLGDGFNMFGDATLIKDYIMEDYLALAEYAKAFDDTDNDGYAEINSANSPLADYKGYLLNYEDIYGSGRIVIETEKTNIPDDGETPDDNNNKPGDGDSSDNNTDKPEHNDVTPETGEDKQETTETPQTGDVTSSVIYFMLLAISAALSTRIIRKNSQTK